MAFLPSSAAASARPIIGFGTLAIVIFILQLKPRPLPRIDNDRPQVPRRTATSVGRPKRSGLPKQREEELPVAVLKDNSFKAAEFSLASAISIPPGFTVTSAWWGDKKDEWGPSGKDVTAQVLAMIGMNQTTFRPLTRMFGDPSPHREKVLIIIGFQGKSFHAWKSPAICTRFVLLTMQRSGSSYTLSEIRKFNGVNTTGEAFNFGNGSEQGGRWADYYGMATSEVEQMGAVRWAEQIYTELERDMPTPCAVGFKVMGPYVDNFNTEQLSPILYDHSVKKIILERRNTYDQWFSEQRACWTHDYTNHHFKVKAHDEESLQEAKEHVARGEFCGPPHIKSYDNYKSWKRSLYSSWREELAGQRYINLTTEGIDQRLRESVLLFLDPTKEIQAHIGARKCGPTICGGR